MQVCRLRICVHPRPPHPLQCSDGKTALKCAIKYYKSDVVSFLRSKGAPE